MRGGASGEIRRWLGRLANNLLPAKVPRATRARQRPLRSLVFSLHQTQGSSFVRSGSHTGDNFSFFFRGQNPCTPTSAHSVNSFQPPAPAPARGCPSMPSSFLLPWPPPCTRTQDRAHPRKLKMSFMRGIRCSSDVLRHTRTSCRPQRGSRCPPTPCTVGFLPLLSHNQTLSSGRE